jgi:hypothetical protein
MQILIMSDDLQEPIYMELPDLPRVGQQIELPLCGTPQISYVAEVTPCSGSIPAQAMARVALERRRYPRASPRCLQQRPNADLV